MNDDELLTVAHKAYGKYRLLKEHPNLASKEATLNLCWLASCGFLETWNIQLKSYEKSGQIKPF